MMNLLPSPLLFLPPLLVFLFASSVNASWPRKAVTVHIFNDSGSHLFVRWVNPDTGEKVELHEKDDPMYLGTVTQYDAFTFDQFEIYRQECHDSKNQDCPHISLTLAGPEHDQDEEEIQMYRIDSAFYIHAITNSHKVEEILHRNPLKTTLHIRNLSRDSFVDLYYIDDDQDGKRIKLTRKGPMTPNKVDAAKSIVAVSCDRGQQFELMETYPCEDPNCPSIIITVPFGTYSKTEPQLVINDNFDVGFVKDKEEGDKDA